MFGKQSHKKKQKLTIDGNDLEKGDELMEKICCPSCHHIFKYVPIKLVTPWIVSSNRTKSPNKMLSNL